MQTDQIWLLQEGARKLGVELSQSDVDRLLVYLEELITWTVKIDLVSQTDPTSIIRKHFLDSIAVLPHIAGVASILDLGSGAGFPGIPLAVLLPNATVSLVEARRKRVNFLKQAARKIDGKNIRVHEGRAEIVAQKSGFRQAFDLVISRATWSNETLLHLATPFLRNGGRIFAMRGPQKRGEHSFPFPCRGENFLVHQREYGLPFGSEQRTILIFERNVPRDTYQRNI